MCIPFDAQRRVPQRGRRASVERPGGTGPRLRRQHSMAQYQREAAGKLHELSTRGFGAGHEPLFIDGCGPPIDLFENNNNIKCKNTKAYAGIDTFICFRLFPTINQ
jgi:hypothetical protein